MKFVCGTAELSEACLNVQRAVSTKTSIPAVEGILIKAVSGQLILTGYDLELGINTAIKATVEEEGSIIINARFSATFCASSPARACDLSPMRDFLQASSAATQNIRLSA